MYHLNKGLFCEKHFQLALIQQEFDMNMEQLREKMANFGKVFFINNK